MNGLRLLLLSLAALVTLSACGSGEGIPPSSVGVQPGGTSGAATVILSASKLVIKPDNSDPSDITAILVDASFAPVPNVTVTFSTDGGLISATTATTNSLGEAKVSFRSGLLANGATATITATAGQATAFITIQAADDRITADMAISATPASIRSNDTDESVITVTVLNSAGSTISSQNVTFSANGGVLVGSSSLSTDNSGRATINLRSGLDKTNRTATVTANSGLISRNIPIQIFGSTLTLTPSTSPSSLSVGQTEAVTVTARDANNNPVSDVDITLAVAGTGGLSLSAETAITNVNGQATFSVTGGSLGTATLTVTGLGATATKTYDISGEEGTEFFRIVEPATEHSSASLNTPVTVLVSAPPPTSQVLFASTLGKWGNGLGTQTVSVVDGTATAQLTSTLAGLANIQASSGPTLSDAVVISFSAAADTADSIHLQASATNIGITVSSGAPQQIALRATVRSSDLQVVGGAPVAFSITNPTGGGESISPPVAYTDEQGLATTIFTSGSLQGAVLVTASLVDFPEKTSQLSINIGGTAMSITLGRATVGTALSPTTYSLPMSVLVSDGSGGPVENQSISLTVWPVRYFATDGTLRLNEDTNKNGIMDPGEDLNCDDELTPPSSVAGNIVPSPPIVTNSTGLGNFNLVYLKAHHGTEVDVMATALVGGSETSSTMRFRLPYLLSDLDTLPAPTFAPPGCGP
jgi:hypothetical protein